MYDIIIVGAGPAGLTAAIYSVRGGMRVLMIDKLGYGGQIINTPEVENYPGVSLTSGFDLATSMYQQATSLGAESESGKVNALEKTDGHFIVRLEDGKTFEAKSVILATGVIGRPMGLEREQDLIGSGVSYCATCDGAFFRGKTVAILGGGNTALEDAEYMASLAEKVYLIHRRDTFRGDSYTVERLKKLSNVTFILNTVPTALLGEPRLTGLALKNVLTGEKTELAVDAAFVAYGHIADNSYFASLCDLDDGGFFAAGENCTTRTEGLFVAGDARAKLRRQLVTATSDGAVAATAAIDYVHATE